MYLHDGRNSEAVINNIWSGMFDYCVFVDVPHDLKHSCYARIWNIRSSLMSNRLNQLILYPDDDGRTGGRNTQVWIIYENAYVNVVHLLVYYANLKERLTLKDGTENRELT